MHRLLRTGILITFGMLTICMISSCGDDDSPEKVMDPPQRKADVPHSPAITVTVDPPPDSDIDVDRTEFTLRFNKEVAAVTVNGVTATGSGQNWNVWAYNMSFEWKEGQVLEIEWKTPDGSTGSESVGPYTVGVVHHVPPALTGGTVADGDVDVDPAPINAWGFRFNFDEVVTGTIKLTDEAGNDLNWVSAVVNQNAVLTPIAGQELVNETTYKIEIAVADGADNRSRWTITFVTKPK